MTKQEIFEEIIEFFNNDTDAFEEIIEELDGYNGFLGDDRYYLMEELTELLQGKDAIDLLNMAFFGRDDDAWHTDASGNKIHGAFNPNRNYFYFNGYGNLVSSDYKDYSYKLDDYFVQDLIDYHTCLYSIDKYENLIELIEKCEELEQSENWYYLHLHLFYFSCIT